MIKSKEIINQINFKDPELKIEYFISKINFNYLFKKHSGNNFILNEENSEVIKTITRYFLGLENFNEFNKISNTADLSKGLLVFGDNGVGKSFLFKIIHQIGLEYRKKTNISTRLNFNQINAKLFVNTYMQEVKKWDSNFNLPSYYTGNLYIGDLGQEDKAFNQKELLGDLLYERNRRKGLTFCTTNLPPSQISLRYGNAIGDRLLSDFNIIKWIGESFR